MNQTFEATLRRDTRRARSRGHVQTSAPSDGADGRRNAHAQKRATSSCSPATTIWDWPIIPRSSRPGIEGLRKYGAGTASVRFICGTLDIHQQLEEKLASFLRFESALSYVSCWTANEGLLPTVATAGNTLISDELNHASIIDGCRLAGAKRTRYKHSDMADLEARLARSRGHALHRDRRRLLDGRRSGQTARDRRARREVRRGHDRRR